MLRRIAVVAAAVGAIWAAPAHAAAWCGTETTADRTPELFGGGSIHVVYAIPSDGPDRLGLIASAMETDVESVDAWWRAQDPTRTPRFDQFPFACGTQADILTQRLGATGAELSSVAAVFSRVAAELGQSGVIGPSNDALVYYDGPVTDPNTCGYGGWYGSGAGLAVVFVGACTRAHTDWAAAHELGHSMGAVSPGAPHLCPDSAHTCDNRQDLMYPYTFGDPLSSYVLDPGHDDYYGNGGPSNDIRNSQYLRHLDAQVGLALTITGAGSVASDVPGVACSASCSTQWDAGTTVALTPSPGPGLRFVRWTGDCTGEAECALTLDSSKSVTAFFAPATFALNASVTGRGAIVSRPAGIVCKPRCRHAFTSYVPVKLTAKPAKGWKLKTWSGACHGKALGCTVPMKAAATAHATFVKKPKPKKKH